MISVNNKLRLYALYCILACYTSIVVVVTNHKPHYSYITAVIVSTYALGSVSPCAFLAI